jgi:hypothetical protein
MTEEERRAKSYGQELLHPQARLQDGQSDVQFPEERLHGSGIIHPPIVP